MKKSIGILCVFLLLMGSTFAVETTIKGKIQNFDGKTIKLGVYKNFFTFEKDWISKIKIEGNVFILKADIKETTQVILKIEDKETSLFLDPGKVYNIKLSYNEEANQGRAYNKFLNLSFPFPEVGETNQLIKKFNTAYQRFFDLNYQKMMYKGATKELIEFVTKFEKVQKEEKNSFVANYIKYTLANLKDINNEPNKNLFEAYLKDESILYQQKEYFNFFSQFYQNDFKELVRKKESQDLLKAIMLENNLNKTREEIIKLKGISNPALAELYLMHGLFEVYHKRTINQKNTIALLNDLAKNATTAANGKIAENMVEVLQRFGKAQQFADFNLKNENGIVKNLASFKGKPIYLGFWSSASIPSLRELKVIQVLNEKYGDKVHFVSVNLDESPNAISSTKTKYNYNWTFLHYGNDYELKERYDIRAVPTYFLIDSEGKLIQSHAPGPTEIEKTLYNLTKVN